jgi:hypothetical protein
MKKRQFKLCPSLHNPILIVGVRRDKSSSKKRIDVKHAAPCAHNTDRRQDLFIDSRDIIPTPAQKPLQSPEDFQACHPSRYTSPGLRHFTTIALG